MALPSTSSNRGFTPLLQQALHFLRSGHNYQTTDAIKKNDVTFLHARKNSTLRGAGCSTGFTLVEVLVVIAVLTGLLAIGIPISWDFYVAYQFDSEIQTLVSILEQARNFSMINRYESPHGVLIDSNQFVIFQGNSYVTRNPVQDKTFPRNGIITITGPNEIVFTSLSGTTTASVYTFTNQHRNVVISVNYHGAILYQ